MKKKSKILLEVEMLSRTRGFKNLREMLNSSDIDTVKLAIGIIEGKKKYPLLASELTDFLEIEGRFSKNNCFNIFNFLGPDSEDEISFKSIHCWDIEIRHVKLLKLRGE